MTSVNQVTGRECQEAPIHGVYKGSQERWDGSGYYDGLGILGV